MNKQIAHVGIAALVLLAALIVGTTYWQTWANAGLANRQDNEIQLVAQFTIKRGKIYAADGRTLLARNVAKKVGGQTGFFKKMLGGASASPLMAKAQMAKGKNPVEALSRQIQLQEVLLPHLATTVLTRHLRELL